MTLPTPDSKALTHIIQEAIKHAGGIITFADFMERALYTPHLGYYQTNTPKLGPQGDFLTAPEISPLFAQCVARQCQDILNALDQGAILEIGAGSGRFAHDLLLRLEELNSLPSFYFILEISETLRTRQQQFLEAHLPHLKTRIVWLDALPTHFNGIIIANEVMDAMPVHSFSMTQNGIKERGVAWQDGQFVWQLMPPTEELQTAIKTLPELPIPYQSEINLLIKTWIQSLADSLASGAILLFDYGYGRKEYYHPDRSMGTLMCFYEHQRQSNPLLYPGLQDITAHVDFTSVAETAVDAGLTLGGYTTQAGFLFACGLLELAALQQKNPDRDYQQMQAIKTLTLPSQMGELIKVMVLTKKCDIVLVGFHLMDRRRDL